MAVYRIYRFDPFGHIAGPPQIIERGTDNDAVEEALQHVGRAAVELWRQDRLVERFEPRS